MRLRGFLFTRPLFDASSTEGTGTPQEMPVDASGSPVDLPPVLTPSERLAKAKELIVGLEVLGVDEIKDFISSASVTIHEVEAKVAAEAQKVWG